MGIILFLIFGFFVGLIARAVMPGRQAMGIGMTTLLGIAGSFVGGFVGNAIANRPVFDLHTAGFLGSLIGALVILAIVVGMHRRRALV